MSTQFVLRIRSRRAGSVLLNASYQSETFFLSARAFAAWASGPIIITPRKKSRYRRFMVFISSQRIRSSALGSCS